MPDVSVLANAPTEYVDFTGLYVWGNTHRPILRHRKNVYTVKFKVDEASLALMDEKNINTIGIREHGNQAEFIRYHPTAPVIMQTSLEGLIPLNGFVQPGTRILVTLRLQTPENYDAPWVTFETLRVL